MNVPRRAVVAASVWLLMGNVALVADEGRHAVYSRDEARVSYPNFVEAIHVTVVLGTTARVSVQFHGGEDRWFGFIAVGEQAGSLLTATHQADVSRYVLQTSSGQSLEFRRRETGRSWLPYSFEMQPAYFLPVCLNEAGEFIDHCEFLGDRFVLARTSTVEPAPLPNSKVIELSDNLLVGTSRNSRDVDGKRIPQSRFAREPNLDYRYHPFDEQDMTRMLDAGMNYFDRVLPEQFTFLADKPVFFDLNSFKGDAARMFPEVFFHPGFQGVEDFLDEPAYILWEDSGESPVANLPEMAKKQEQATSDELQRKRRGCMTGLMEHLSQAEIDLGDIELVEPPLPIWEEFYDTACYQLRVPATGFIHEGRYQHPEVVDLLNNTFRTSLPRRPETMFRFYFAFLRGGARLFDKDWGMSIYGQADPKISLDAIKAGYDRGARYIFFWSSDRDHHLPFEEQLTLAKGLSAHVREHPRTSRPKLVRAASDAILLPFGFTFPISDWKKDRMEDLWQRKCFPLDGGQLPDGTPYYSVLRCATEKMQQLIADGVEFDIVVDVPELAAAGYSRLHDILPETKQKAHQYPRWIHYKLYFLLAGLVTFWIGYRAYRIVRSYRRRRGRQPAC